MVRIVFKDLPDTTTPVNADNLNAIQDNTETAINSVATTASTDLANATKTLLSTPSGKDQEISNCAGASGKINIESGETYQDNTSGYQLLKQPTQQGVYEDNGIYNEYYKDGTYYIHGTASANTQRMINCNTGIIEEYSNSGFAHLDAGTYIVTIIPISGTPVNIRFRSGTNNYINNSTGGEFTVDSAIDNFNIYIYTGNTATIDFKFKIMLEKGTTAHDWEKYTGALPAPNPDYPQDIVNVGSNINLLGLPDKTTTTSYGITYSISNNELTLNGTATSNGAINISNLVSNIEVTNGYNYTFISEESGKSSRTYNVQFKDSNDTAITSMYNNDFPITKNTLSGTISKLYLYVYNGMTFNNVKLKLKIQEGSQATGYSKYNAGSIDYKVRTKNDVKYSDSSSSTISNVTCSIENDVITLNGNANAQGTIQDTTIFDLEAGNYTLSIQSISGSWTAGAIGIAGRAGSTQKWFIQQVYNATSATKEITQLEIEANTTCRLYFTSAGKFSNFKFKIQLERGTSPSSWQPYNVQKITIPLPEGMELCKIGNYKDYIYKSNGKWHKHKEIGKIVLNGTENWAKSSKSTVNRYSVSQLIDTVTDKDNVDIISNYFICITQNQSDNDYIGMSKLNYNGIMINFELSDTNFDTLQKFTTWLSNNNTTVYYRLGTPIEEEITDVDTIYYLEHFPIYKEYTSIECINEVKPDMHIDYLYDNEVNNYWGKELDSLAEKLHNLEVGE